MDATGKRALIFAGDEYEDLELWYPKLRLEEAGAQVTLAGPEAGKGYRGKHGYPCTSDASVAEIDPAAFDALVVPGGWMPDKLRRDERVRKITRAFADAQKPLAAICHGPWIVQSAGLCAGRRMTGSPGIRDDLVYAGAEWVDEPVVTDDFLITSRRPADLPAFAAATLKHLAASAAARA